MTAPALAVAAISLAVDFFSSPAVQLAPAAARAKIDIDIAQGNRAVCRTAPQVRGIWLPIAGINWLFAIGAAIRSKSAPLPGGVVDARKPGDLLTLALADVVARIAPPRTSAASRPCACRQPARSPL
ncbi:hypothetical protein GCM10011529_12220 [Polymorphobacter glacialis]|uniref:Uncharacterized protein n=1 Tax=Sandarakinorhabdus glacialis TaxID=1614636 RepID=A0A916ZQ72_9SPHN|nr:hypothetical protein [Polymorphobacter glacialis]GGE07360.1 hypothetical protein GCM10011529_12220 [Polymorphobacter glacialis]